MNEERHPVEGDLVLLGFVLCGLAGAIMGGLAVGLAWWLS